MANTNPETKVQAPSYGLTRSQRDCLLVIQELTTLDGIPPSFQDIADELVTSKSEVSRFLHVLRAKGRLDWLPGKYRSIVVRNPIPMPEEPVIVGFFS